MNNELVKLAAEARRDYLSDKKYHCDFCGRSFIKESTMMAHMCEQKRRHDQRRERHVQLGLQAFMFFFKETSPNQRERTYTDFRQSNYYNAFCKFGKFMIDYNVINPRRYMEYIIRSKFKLDKWCTESYYTDWLPGYLKTEHWQDAIERSLKTMGDWADKEGVQINSYFIGASTNKIVQDIINARVSPWIIYNCETGRNMLSKLNQEQVQLVYQHIDPDYWRQYFIKMNRDSKSVKDTLKEVGF